MLLRLLDERHDVAHAEDARGHAVRKERFERIELFAHTHELERFAGDRPDRERRAAAGVAVELGQHHPVEADGGVELLGDVHGFLAGHGVCHEQRLMGFDRGFYLPELIHERLIYLKPACGVKDNDLEQGGVRMLERCAADRDRVLVVGSKSIYPHLFREGLELLDRRRPARVGRDQEHPASILFKGLCQLARGRCFTRPLQADHHDDRGRVR